MKHKIVVISTGDINGAYEAMYKVSKILLEMDYEVVMLVKDKTKSDNFIKPYLRKKPKNNIITKVVNKINNVFFSESSVKKIEAKSEYSFLDEDESSSNIDVNNLLKIVGFIPDFIFVGMTSNFINSSDIYKLYKKTNAQIYNITVDMSFFTGGCHYSWGCQGYVNGCDDNCPAIINQSQKYIAKKNFDTKYNNALKSNFKVIAASGLTLEQSKESKIYKNQNEILNVNSMIDTRVMNTFNKATAKEYFGFEEDKFYILSGAQNLNDPRKGFKYLIEALQILSKNLREYEKEKIILILVSREVNDNFNSIDFQTLKIDYIKDYNKLSLLYQATNLFINTSIEESGPMMVSEALACGTPVVGFDTGILVNMIRNDFNGYKVPLKDSVLLAKAIEKIIKLNKEDYNNFSKNSVLMVEENSSFEYAKEVFKKILNS